MVRLSTGLSLSMLGNYGLMIMMNYGSIRVYTGDQPLSPDLAPTGALLGRITTNGDPFVPNDTGQGALALEQDVTGLLRLTGTWMLTGEADGTAGWWRWVWNTFDSGEQSFYYPRVDGLVGESLVLADPLITTSTSVEIDSFNVQFRG